MTNEAVAVPTPGHHGDKRVGVRQVLSAILAHPTRTKSHVIQAKRTSHGLG